MNDIHPLKPLLEAPFPWLSVLLSLSLMLGSILLLALILWKLFGKKKQESHAKEHSALPPEKEALQALQALEKKQNALSASHFYTELNQILQRFLARIHEVPAEAWTHSEIQRFLPEFTESPLSSYLSRATEAKYNQKEVSEALKGEDLKLIKKHLKKGFKTLA